MSSNSPIKSGLIRRNPPRLGKDRLHRAYLALTTAGWSAAAIGVTVALSTVVPTVFSAGLVVSWTAMFGFLGLFRSVRFRFIRAERTRVLSGHLKRIPAELRNQVLTLLNEPAYQRRFRVTIPHSVPLGSDGYRKRAAAPTAMEALGEVFPKAQTTELRSPMLLTWQRPVAQEQAFARGKSVSALPEDWFDNTEAACWIFSAFDVLSSLDGVTQRRGRHRCPPAVSQPSV